VFTRIQLQPIVQAVKRQASGWPFRGMGVETIDPHAEIGFVKKGWPDASCQHTRHDIKNDASSV